MESEDVVRSESFVKREKFSVSELVPMLLLTKPRKWCGLRSATPIVAIGINKASAGL